MRAVLNETLRLFPPVPLNVRESRPAAVSLPPSHPPKYSLSGVFIPTPKEPLYMPGSTPIMYMPMLMQRNPDLWGPDADKFDPERWLDPKRITMITSNPMMFTPFSSGPRIVSSLPSIMFIHAFNSPCSAWVRTLRIMKLPSSLSAFCNNLTPLLWLPNFNQRARVPMLGGKPNKGVKRMSNVGQQPH